ncbi:hypothetical protein OPT61_g5869 [Boeremia exigua]|uniref:Uncharacterized protein n=1 Tax=Boeremia exigua TaxID=749465 RepID=A0ACC2I8U1_9PLEO|nr:hypothetical protein OPT61_g5869 [Boeremia exigua]
MSSQSSSSSEDRPGELNTANRIAPHPTEGVFPGNINIVANFFQSQAQRTGEGDFRAYPFTRSLLHPSLLKEKARSTASKQVVGHYFPANVPMDSIAYRPDYSWTSTDKKRWEELSLHQRTYQTNGFQHPFPEISLLFTVQFVFMNTGAKNKADPGPLFVLHDSIASAVLVVVDKKAQHPILCGWADEFRDKLPSQQDFIDEVIARKGSFTVENVQSLFSSALFFRNDACQHGAQILLSEADRQKFYSADQQDLIRESQVDNWGDLHKRIAEMTANKSEVRMFGKDFRKLFLYESKPKDRVDPTQFRAIAREVIEMLSIEDDSLCSEDDTEDGSE